MNAGGGRGAQPTPAESEIRRRIAASGPITFSEFMDLALHGEGGYYARDGATTGAEGDFFTAPDAGPAFGRALARQVAEVWELAGRPAAFEVIEVGPGRGRLAEGLLEGLRDEAPALFATVTLTLDERSGALRRTLEDRLAGRLPRGWLRFEPGGVASRPARSWTGVLLANELLDALPVHRVVRRGGALREVAVSLDGDGRLREVLVDPSAEVRAFAERRGAARGEGEEAEVGLAARDLVAGAACSLERGALVFVDYGVEAGPPMGTLAAYRGHRMSADLLAHAGRQDLTAHVDWAAIDDAARESGLARLGRTTQARFLLALGLGDDLAAPEDGREDVGALRRRLALRALVLPQAMGRRFQVSIYGRGIEGPLRGLGDVPGGASSSDPGARERPA